jgi:hypothetical protein
MERLAEAKLILTQEPYSNSLGKKSTIPSRAIPPATLFLDIVMMKMVIDCSRIGLKVCRDNGGTSE